jgi:hypothetical protein
MTSRTIITGIPSTVKKSVGVLFFFGCIINAIPLGDFIQTAGLGVVIIPTIFSALWLKLKVGFPVGKFLMLTSVPMGILMTLVSMHVILQTAGENSVFLPGTAAAMLLTIFYAVILTVVGYAIDESEEGLAYKADIKALLLPVILLLLMMIIAIQSSVGSEEFLSTYFSAAVASIFFGIFCLLLLGKKQIRIGRALVDTSIIGIIFSLIISLVGWFNELSLGGIPIDALNIATLGMIYGSLIFVASFYTSIITQETTEINFGVKNWHLIELAALYILLVFAPPSIFEVFS